MLTALVLIAALQADLSGTVFVDRNGNGIRDAGEPGLAGVSVSDQSDVVVTDATGNFHITNSHGFGVVFVAVPRHFRAVGNFWRRASEPLNFALRPAPERRELVFIHASDTHISPASLARTQRFRALADSIRPDFVIVSGDLVRDALRVGEAEARSYYDLFQGEAARFTVPFWTVPGNHEVFGIERARSNVAPDHPLIGRGMYRSYRGPDYYSFNAGGVHFVGLNSVDIEDQWYYGHVDSVQLAWLAKDLALVPANVPVVTFQHIPFFTAGEIIGGYQADGPAPSVITVRGQAQFRHNVANQEEALRVIAPHPLPLALGGHVHIREALRYEGVATRFDNAAAIVGPSEGASLSFPSGITVYRLRGGVISEGAFVAVD